MKITHQQMDRINFAIKTTEGKDLSEEDMLPIVLTLLIRCVTREGSYIQLPNGINTEAGKDLLKRIASQELLNVELLADMGATWCHVKNSGIDAEAFTRQLLT